MMKALRVVERFSDEELSAAARKEHDRRVKTRILIIRYIRQGHSALQAGKVFALSRTQACMWVHRYNEQGLEGLREGLRSGRPAILKSEQVDRFKKCLERGPGEEEGLSAYRGEDIQQILREKFQADYSLSGTYFLVHRLGFSSLVPRPQHPKSDPEEALAQLKKG